MIIWMNGSIKNYLEANKIKQVAKVFPLSDFKIFFQKEGISPKDLIILKFSKKTYIIAIPTLSTAQIIINHNDEDLKDFEQYFLEELSANIYDIKKDEKCFLSFMVWEIKDRWIFWILIFLISLLVPILTKEWLLMYSKDMVDLVFPLIGVYFALMVIFLSSTTLHFSQKKFLEWRVAAYFSNDMNMAYLSIYTMLYILFLYTIIALLGNKWYYILYYDISIGRYLLSLWVGWMVFLVFINFFNLVEYHMKTQQNFVLWKMKDDFFKSLHDNEG